MPQIEANGVRLYYEEQGRGAPILGIHGTGSSAMLWSEAVPVLATLGRVIVYDRRGCTRSERPRPFSAGVGTHVDDAAALLGALSAGPAIVIGRSYGGAVAIQLALRYPARVRALVLLEAFIGSLVPEAEAWETELARRLEAVASTSDDAVAQELIHYGLGEGAWATFPDEIKRMFTDNTPAILDEELDPPAMDDPSELGRINVPTFVVGAASSDPVFAMMNERIAQGIPGAAVSSVGGGHVIAPDHPDVLAFVDKVLKS